MEMMEGKYLNCYWCDDDIDYETALQFSTGITAFCSDECRNNSKKNDWTRKGENREQIESYINQIKALIENVSFYYFSFDEDVRVIYQGDLNAIKELVARLEKISIDDTSPFDYKIAKLKKKYCPECRQWKNIDDFDEPYENGYWCRNCSCMEAHSAPGCD